MKKIEEVIVVEGKDDTKAINRAVNADTIETRGSAVPEEIDPSYRRHVLPRRPSLRFRDDHCRCVRGPSKL